MKKTPGASEILEAKLAAAGRGAGTSTGPTTTSSTGQCPAGPRPIRGQAGFVVANSCPGDPFINLFESERERERERQRERETHRRETVGIWLPETAAFRHRLRGNFL